LVAGEHLYTAPGTYTVRLTLQDNFGNQDASEYQFVVVYDPSGGALLGGGGIDSPPGAYRPDPAVDGALAFGFFARYERGQRFPTGRAEIHLKGADLNFQSTSFDWLVISGGYAWLKGSGLVNGQPGYKILIWAQDGSPDTFRVRIWQVVSGVEVVLYDNGFAQPIAAGKIMIQGR
jgi:hypothetical protein